MSTYPKRKGWVTPVMQDYKLACCDCGLVHKVTFRVVQIGTEEVLQFKTARDNRSTAALRREMRKRGQLKCQS